MGGKRIDRDELIRLHRFGLTGAVIAERLGCSQRQVERIRSEMGFTRRVCNTGIPVPDARLLEAERMLDGGASFAEVRRTLRMGYGTLPKYFPGRAWSHQEVGSFATAVRRAREAGFSL